MNYISFCLFGRSPNYRVGALRNAELAPRIYPGWQVVCWVDPGIPSDLALRLREMGWRLLPMDGSLQDRRSYRMLVADLQDADAFVVRDIDSRLNPREKAAVEQFLASDRQFHGMRDHPGHKWPVMAGLWGARKGLIGDMKGLLANWEARRNGVGPVSDQEFLASVIWPHVKHGAMVHDSIGEYPDRAGVVDFPTPREGRRFVGEAYDDRERRRVRGRKAMQAWLDSRNSSPAESGHVHLLEIHDRSRGMFSVVNEVVDHLYVAERRNYRFIVSWRSCFEQEGMGPNAWSYYFEDCFDLDDSAVVRDLLPRDSSRAGNLITPRSRAGLGLPRDRDAMKVVIDRYLRLKEPVQRQLNAFRERHLQPGRPVLGVHIRGPGRRDGGVGALKQGLVLQEGVPLQLYFRYIDEHLDQRTDCRILLCSDAQRVIDACERRYGGRLILYPASRTPKGEAHRSLGRSRQGYKLGEDVLIEAYLLSGVDFLIHGNSNVTNFVLCNNPSMDNLYVYG